MNDYYVYLTIGHKSFTKGKTAIVKVSEDHEFIDMYKALATTKVCEQLNLKEDEVLIFDFKFLGDDVLLIN